MKNILLSFRPKTLFAAISPICIGTAMAAHQGSFHFWVLLFTLLTGLGVQISTNVANDLFDFLKGADTAARKGRVRVTASGLLSIAKMKLLTFAVLSFTAICGSVLIIRGGWVISILVALALLCAIGYTAGPFSLAYLGLSEFFVLIFFGPVATGCTYYLQTLELSRAAFIAGLAPGLFSCAILVINHLRDVEEDRIAGRKNLICRFGTTFGKWEYAIAILAGLLIPLYFHEKHLLQLLCSLCVIPGAILVLTVMKNKDPHTYNLLLAKTGKFLFLYSTIFSIGYFL